MPELPEVQNVALALRRHLLERRLTGLEVRFAGVLSDPPRTVRRQLLGKRLRRVHRHGKYLILGFAGDDDDDGSSLVRDGSGRSSGLGSRPSARSADRTDGRLPDPPACWMLHLRMTGQIFILDGYRPDKHVHLVLDFDGLPVHYRDIRKFGRFTLVDHPVRPTALDHVGPDVLEVTFPQWRDRIAGRRAPVKALLLDQGIAAGLGNIYVDEALFRAGIHPAAVPADLSADDLRRLFRSARSVLRLAVRHGGTTLLNFTDFHGKPGNFRRKLRVYGRTGEACRTCGAAIERIVIAGRSSHFCPGCQRG